MLGSVIICLLGLLSPSIIFADTPPADSPHLLFHSQKDANIWIERNLPIIAMTLGDSNTTLVAADDPRVGILNGYVKELWEGFKKVFPAQIEKLNQPPVVLLK